MMRKAMFLIAALGLVYAISLSFASQTQAQTFTITVTVWWDEHLVDFFVDEAAAGSTKRYTITPPEEGSYISEVVVDGEPRGPVSEVEFIDINENHTLTVYFKKYAYIISRTLCTEVPVSGYPECDTANEEVLHGAEYKICSEMTNPRFYYRSLDIDGNNRSDLIVEEKKFCYTFSNVTSNHTISVLLGVNYFITASAGSGGSISPSGEVVVRRNGSQTFIITPDPDYRVADIIVDGESGGSSTFNGVTDDHTIHVTFEQDNPPPGKPGVPIHIDASAPPSFDDDTVLEFCWSPASGDVYHYNVYLSVDSSAYSLVGTTSTAPTPENPYTVSATAEDGKTYRLKVEAEDAGGRTGPMSDPSEMVVCDLLPPPAPVISSPAHPKNIWIRSDSPCFEWTEPSGISGIDCYSYVLDLSPGTIPDENCEANGTSKCYSGLEEEEWYFHIRARDGVGNWGQTGHYGPVKVWLYIHVDANASGSDGTPDAPYKCIQDGIDAASDDDIVLVADGEYTGARNVNLDFNGKAITVRSENGPRNCVIDCSPNQDTRGFYFHSGEDSSSVVQGFTIQNGLAAPNYESGGGICCQNSSPTIKGNIIIANSAGKGGGIFCSNSSPTIVNNFIAENGAPKGGGIYCDAGSAPLIINSTIIKNQASSLSGGGGILCDNSSVTVTNTILWDNVVSKGPDEQVPQQIYLGGGTLVISYSDIQGGQAEIGGNVSGVVWGTGNINSTPLLDLSKGLYYIKCESPCAGAGTSVGAPAYDIECSPRPDPPGSPPDIGAYESPCGGGELVPLELELSEGWNLISLCIDPVNSDIDDILAPIAANYTSVWTYDAVFGIWRRHIPSNPSISDLGTVEARKGYWINMHASDTLTIEGQRIADTAVPLYQGWNMVGYSSSVIHSVGGAMSSIAGSYSCIYTYDANIRQWLKYCVDAPQFLNELDALKPGVGYIIYAEQACIWELSP